MRTTWGSSELRYLLSEDLNLSIDISLKDVFYSIKKYGGSVVDVSVFFHFVQKNK